MNSTFEEKTMKALNCPNCGGAYNPTKMRCEFCGNFIIMTDKEFDVPKEIVSEIKSAMIEANNTNSKQPGVYIFGSLIGKGEVPLRLGPGSYYKSLIAVGGKILLTESNLYFSSHTFAQGKTDVCIPLSSVLSVQQTSSFGVSQTITVATNDKNYKFLVYHGKRWVAAIENAKNENIAPAKNVSINQQTNDYTDELRKLKDLLDAGIITEDEFAVKKRQILNI